MTRLADATWPEVEAAPRTALVIPLGSLEQHGPHLPLDTDAAIAEAVAEAIVAARPTAVVAPTLTIGASGEHAGFPGTLSIGTDALTSVLVELVRDAGRDWRTVVVVNGHGGNADALRLAGDVWRSEGRRVAVAPCALPGMDGHAGRAETSLMLALCPARVRLDRAVAGRREPIDVLLPDLIRGGVRAVSPNGVLGDPTGAGAAEGRQLFDAVVTRALATYDRVVSSG